MRKTVFWIVTDRVEFSNHGLAINDIEENPQNSGVNPLLRNKERAVLCSGE